MKIRTFNITDKHAVIQLWQSCDLTRPWNNPELDIDRKMAVGPELFLVAELEGAIVGSIMGGYDGHRGWINYLAVHPDIRKKGLGRRLMDAIEERLLEKNCPKINLQIRHDNDAVIDFYRAIGYSEDQCVSFGKRIIPDN